MVLVGAHGADRGVLGILAAVGMTRVRAAKGAANALKPTPDALAGRGVRRMHVHLGPDVLDAAWAPANGSTALGGLLPDRLAVRVGEVTSRFPSPLHPERRALVPLPWSDPEALTGEPALVPFGVTP